MGRRSALKTITAFGAAVTVGTTTAAGRDGGPVPADELELPYPETSVTRIDDSVREVTANPELLTLTREAIDRHFEASDLDGRAYDETRRYVASLRKEFPVERVTNGNETTIRLEPDVTADTVVPGKEEPEKRDLHGKAIDVFAGEGPGQVVDPDWDKSHHREITEVLLDDTIGTDYTIKSASDDPDDFGADAKGRVEDVGDQIDLGYLDVAKDVVVDMVAGALDVYHSNYSQYYDPSIGSIPLGPLGSADVPVGLGKAPQAGDAFFAEATDSGNSSYTQEKRLGWSLHYLQDCAQPLHTSMGLEQAGLHVEYGWDGLDWDFSKKKWVHYGFEHIVNNNWESEPSFGGDDLKTYMTAPGSPSGIYSAEQAIEDMADNSTGYGSDIYYTVYNNEQSDTNYWNWDDSTKQEIYEDLANCFSTLGYLGHGFCEEWNDQT